jgi:hypothetical protein
MKTVFIKALALTASAVVYSHAIFGIGAQWAPASSLEVKSDRKSLVGTGATEIFLNQAKVSGLQGFGVKLWVDALPFIDVEAGSNIQLGYYDLSIIQGTDSIPVKFDLKVPGVDGKPAFVRVVNDLTILYPFLKFPPLISVIKLYAGAGITHVLATEVLNSDFGKKAISKQTAVPTTAAEVSKVLIKSITDEGLTSGIGFHLEAGAKAKIPIIPIAVYADVKYHMLSSMPKAVDANSMTYELGAALAF